MVKVIMQEYEMAGHDLAHALAKLEVAVKQNKFTVTLKCIRFKNSIKVFVFEVWPEE